MHEREVGGQRLGRLVGRAHDDLPGVGVERLLAGFQALKGHLGTVGRRQREGRECARIETQQVFVPQILLGVAQGGEQLVGNRDREHRSPVLDLGVIVGGRFGRVVIAGRLGGGHRTGGRDGSAEEQGRPAAVAFERDAKSGIGEGRTLGGRERGRFDE